MYLDVDDVLAETTRAIARVASELFGTGVRFEQMRTFNLQHSLALTAQQHDELVSAIHEPDFLSGLSPIDGAVEHVERLATVGARVSVVTGRPPDSRAPTESWLQAHGFSFEVLHMVDKYDRHQGPDVVSLEALPGHGYDVAVEDSPSVARFLANHGVRVLLFDRPWNHDARLPQAVERVHSWEQVAERLF